MPNVSTYHCLCTELILASTSQPADLPRRKSDGSLICKISPGENITADSSIITSAVATEDKPIVLNLDDGFEKRYPARCTRCGLMFGYQLDLSQWEGTKDSSGRRENVVYVIPNGFLSTEDISAGKKLGDREVEIKAGWTGGCVGAQI